MRSPILMSAHVLPWFIQRGLNFIVSVYAAGQNFRCASNLNVLRHIIRKFMIYTIKTQIAEVVASQWVVCLMVDKPVSKYAARTMLSIFAEEETDAILLGDVSNSFKYITGKLRFPTSKIYFCIHGMQSTQITAMQHHLGCLHVFSGLRKDFIYWKHYTRLSRKTFACQKTDHSNGETVSKFVWLLGSGAQSAVFVPHVIGSSLMHACGL